MASEINSEAEVQTRGKDKLELVVAGRECLDEDEGIPRPRALDRFTVSINFFFVRNAI